MSKFHMRPNIYVTEIVLKVGDIRSSIEFYKNIMGFRVLEGSAEGVKLTANGSTPIITLVSPKDAIPMIPKRTGLYHFAILLPNRLQLGLFLKHIRNQGYPLTGASHHGVSEAIYLKDPSGNGIEVYADTPEESWKWKNENINMVTERLDHIGLIKATGDENWEGVPTETIIGHIHLHVRDLDEAEKFYNALGFNLVQSIENQAYFVSTGGYHHHIGFNIWNGKGAEPLPENSVGMKYFTIEYPNEDSRELALKKLKGLDTELLEDGDEIFVYDPSHNLIQLKI
ncbi:MAG: VOC family protein [Gottschalkiaceae bacterium]|nr:MAG: VOC family protein [Gottschalkiaceae bacterium]